MMYLGLCCHFVLICDFFGEAAFHEYEKGNIGREFWFIVEPDPYIDVNDIVGYESASWSEDVVSHVNPVLVLEWDVNLFWALKRFT